MFKRLAIAAVSFVAIGGGVLAQSNPNQPAADTVTKVHALGDGGAIVEGNHGDDYAVWRVDASGAKWTKLVLPALAKTDKAAEDGSAASWTDLEFTNGRLVLFTLVDEANSNARKLMQATSTDLGTSWQVIRAVASVNDFASVEQYVAVDANHAWLIVAGDPGAGQLPAALLTTANGGKTWTKVQDSMHGGTMGLGMNSPVLLHAKNALSAWFVVDCVNCEPDAALSVFLTSDGGRLWHKERLPKATFCKDCMPIELTDDSARTKGCVSATLMTDTPGANKTEHFCTANDGLTWTAPVAGPTPLAAGVAPVLAVSASCKDMPKDAQHTDVWSQCVLQESSDGGKMFKTILPELTGQGLSGVQEFSVAGSSAWVIAQVGAGSTNVLAHSEDGGGSWQMVVVQ